MRELDTIKVVGKSEPVTTYDLLGETGKLDENLQKLNERFKIALEHYKNQRWDLYFENNILLQLPSKNISEALELFNQFKENKKFNPNSIIDLRIKGRLIFKDG